MRSLLRITAAVLVASLTGAALIRQPVLTALRSDRDAPRADAEALRKHVVFLTTTAAPRGAAHPENLDLAATYIENAFRTAGARVTLQEFDARKRRYRNVIARFGPNGGPPLIVGAHYDAFCETGPLPGADDNASGTAGLLELSRLLGKTNVTIPIVLVAHANEEPPYLRNPHYHTRDDKADTLDYERMARAWWTGSSPR